MKNLIGDLKIMIHCRLMIDNDLTIMIIERLKNK